MNQGQTKHPQLKRQHLLLHSGFIANTVLPKTSLILAPSLAAQPKILNYSHTLHFSTKPIVFENKSKTQSSELPQPIHTILSNKNESQVISLLSESSNPGPLNPQLFCQLHHKSQLTPFILHNDRLLTLKDFFFTSGIICLTKSIVHHFPIVCYHLVFT